jgi:hypothetical protein
MVVRIVWIVAACIFSASALGDDLATRALRERQQQSDAFSLQLQQSIQNQRAGQLSPRERLEFDALQRDQRRRQDELFYRQGAQQNAPLDSAPRRAETMRLEQERQMQQDRFTRDAERDLSRPKPATPNPQPAPR